MKDGVQSIVSAAAIAYDPANAGLEPVRTALDNLKHSLERLDRSAALDIKSLAEIVETHRTKAAFGAGYGHGHSVGMREGIAKALTLIEIEFDKLAANTKIEGGKG